MSIQNLELDFFCWNFEGFILSEELARDKFIDVMLVISQSKKCARSRRATRHNGSRHKKS